MRDFFEPFPISAFEVDSREIHTGSAQISTLKLKPSEKTKEVSYNFHTHVVVLKGEVLLKDDTEEVKLKQGCMLTILPGKKHVIENLSSDVSRVLIIRDNPLWIIQERRSVRKFLNIPIPKNVIETILSISRLAPSGGNVQPWKIYAISNDEIKRKLVKAAYGQDFIEEAPWVVVVTAIPEESEKEYGDRGKNLYSIQDTASLTTYLMLTAKAFGLDTCWVGAFDEKQVSEILDLPENQIPVSIVPIGYGAERPNIPQRKALDIVVEYKE